MAGIAFEELFEGKNFVGLTLEVVKLEKLKKYKHIIWDWNGTLVNDVDFSIDVINKVLSRRRMQTIDYDLYREIFGFPIKDYYKELGFTYENESFEDVSNEFMYEYNRQSCICKLHEEVENILKRISDGNIRQSILSAMHEVELNKAVKDMNIDNHFYRIMGLSNNYAESKVDIGKHFMNEIGLNPGEVLLIGDTIHDYEVACELECDCILVSKGHQSTSRLKRLNITVVDSLVNLL